MRAGARVALIALGLAACGKGAPPTDAPSPRESPQAKAEPAPLALGPPLAVSAATATAGPDAGPPPADLRGDQRVPPDVVQARESSGYTLRAVLRTAELPGTPRGPEVNAAAIDAARRRTEPRLTIDLTAAHARITLASGGFVLPEDTELRARADRYGFVVVLPTEPAYRVVAPGALRALVGERRIDVAPLSPAEVVSRGEGARRLSYRTRRVDVTNRAASATFEVARIPDVGDGGVLVCRALLDLMNAPQGSPVCAADEVPLHVDLRWTTRGVFTFDAFELARRLDVSPASLATPPAAAPFALPALPPAGSATLVPASELAAFRTAAIDVPPAATSPFDPPSGLALVNLTDELRFVWLDGVPVAWVAPGARETLSTLLRGRYAVEWRTFLGDAYEPPHTAVAPGAAQLGSLDAGAAAAR